MGRAGLRCSLHQRKVIHAAAEALLAPWRHCPIAAPHIFLKMFGKQNWAVICEPSTLYIINCCGPVVEVVNGLPEAQPLAGGLTPKG